MLPLSVEGANSLLTSVALMDADRPGAPFTAIAVPLIQRFWAWLRARAMHFEYKGQRCVGWHSEHVNEPNLVHTWDTSQVMEFMLGFRQLMERHLAATTLRLSGVSVREPQDIRSSLRWTNSKDPTWSDVIAAREPVLGSLQLPHVYSEIGSEFVAPWEDLERSNLSMLIYGPPGTGKTSLAEFIADKLGLRMLTITVSDFLGTGGAMVEARAKAIFDMLIAQADVLILFDEIDAFLLDRDSEHYREQESLFKFLTPGMLTKFNDLRRAERSLFVIATNYENRIDPAIKRVGRIDRKFLVLPPDRARRRAIIRQILKGRTPALTASNLDALADSALFLGYKEIEGAIRKAGGKSAPFGALLDFLEKEERSTGFKQYFDRLGRERPYPSDELRALLALAEEARALSNVNEAIKSLEPAQQQKLAEIIA